MATERVAALQGSGPYHQSNNELLVVVDSDQAGFFGYG